MGGSTSSESFNSHDWKILPSLNNEVIVLENNRNKNIHIQKYLIGENTAQAQEAFRELYQFRKNNRRIVSALYYETNEQQASFCPSSYGSSLYIQKIPFTLQDVQGIPFPDILHVYDQCLHGYFELARFMGCFAINRSYIGVNELGVVKVWGGQNWSKISVKGGTIHEQNMIKILLSLINSITDSNTLPQRHKTPIQFILSQVKQQLTFEQVIKSFKMYVNLTNNGDIPAQLARYKLNKVNRQLQTHGSSFGYAPSERRFNSPRSYVADQRPLEPIMTNNNPMRKQTVNPIYQEPYPTIANTTYAPTPQSITTLRSPLSHHTPPSNQHNNRASTQMNYFPSKQHNNNIENITKTVVYSAPQPPQQNLNTVRSQPNLYTPIPANITMNKQAIKFQSTAQKTSMEPPQFVFNQLQKSSSQPALLGRQRITSYTIVKHNQQITPTQSTRVPFPASYSIKEDNVSALVANRANVLYSSANNRVQNVRNNNQNIYINREYIQPSMLPLSSQNRGTKSQISTAEILQHSQSQNIQAKSSESPIYQYKQTLGTNKDYSPIISLQSKYLTPAINKNYISQLNSIEQVQTQHLVKQDSPFQYKFGESQFKKASFVKDNQSKVSNQYNYFTSIQQNDGKSSQSFLKSLKSLKTDFNVQNMNTSSQKYDPFKFSSNNYEYVPSAYTYNAPAPLQDTFKTDSYQYSPTFKSYNYTESAFPSTKYDKHNDFKSSSQEQLRSYSNLEESVQKKGYNFVAVEEKSFDNNKKYENKYDSSDWNRLDPDLLQDLGRIRK